MSVADEAYLAADSISCFKDREALLALDYMTFDQDYGKGFRVISHKDGCKLAAADLIRDYHARLRETGEPIYRVSDGETITISDDGAVAILYWHEGQIRAFEDQTDAAISLFRKSLKPKGKNFGAWNQYAKATIAFLEQDIDALKFEREILAKHGDSLGVNLGVVDGLIACFGQSYAEAYGAQECNRRPNVTRDYKLQ